MTQRTRIFLAIGILVVIVAAVAGIEVLRLQTGAPVVAQGEPTLIPGGIPIYVNGKLVGSFSPADLQQLQKASFVDAAQQKTQEGWLLRDVLRLRGVAANLKPDTLITVSSSSRQKSVQLTWAEVDDPKNQVLLDLTNRGTLKLASVMPKLSTRDQWIQDADKIEVKTP